jgi:uncharacterized protein YdeI (YjbR/CyaY-like superfamily)
VKNDKDGQPIAQFKSQTDLERWLKKNHATSPGIWIQFAKKGSGVESITHDEAVEVALCYGWIDAQTASFDDIFWLQRLTRRSPKSKWSKINCQKATDLITRKKMKAPGLKQVELAKQDGRWQRAYESPGAIQVPDDLRKKLDENPKAREFFESLDSKNRYAILYRLHDAKKPETRIRRIEKFIAMLVEGKKIH